MTETFTQCPYCQTSFVVSETHLSAADGIVRCGACLNTFEVSDYIISPNEVNSPDLNLEGPANAVSLQAHSGEDKSELQQSLLDLGHEDSLETLQPGVIAAIQEDPIEVAHSKPSVGMSMALLSVLCLLLLTLAGQFIWANFDKVVQNPSFDPITNSICSVLACPEKDSNDLAGFVAEEIIVRSHPLYANALQVDFIFYNQSSTEQNFPLAQLSFTDTHGQLLAQRLFTASEYLPEDLQHLDKMPAGAKIQTLLEIVDPGQGATNYAIDFK